MRIRAKKQPTITPVEDLSDEGPVKPSCGLCRLWKRLFWKHRPRVAPAVTSPVRGTGRLPAHRQSMWSVNRLTGMRAESGQGDYLVTSSCPKSPSPVESLEVIDIIDKGNVTVEQEVDLMLDRPDTPTNLYLRGTKICPPIPPTARKEIPLAFGKPTSELSMEEASQMVHIGNELNDLLAEVRDMSRQMDDIIFEQGRRNNTRLSRYTQEFSFNGPAKDCPMAEDDDSVDFSDHGDDDKNNDESDTISWASSEPRGQDKKTVSTRPRVVRQAWVD